MSTARPRVLTVDREACAGHGLCYGAAPDLIDCDEQGDPIVPERILTGDELTQALEAVSLCPERALSLRPPIPAMKD